MAFKDQVQALTVFADINASARQGIGRIPNEGSVLVNQPEELVFRIDPAGEDIHPLYRVRLMHFVYFLSS
jgi:hypothetical protein